MNEKFFISPLVLRYQKQAIVFYIIFLLAYAVADVGKLPAVYLVQRPPFFSFIIDLIFLLFMGATLVWVVKIIYTTHHSYLEITDTTIEAVGQWPFTLPLAEITKWEINTSADQKIMDVLLWRQGQKYMLGRFAPLEKIVELLEAKLPLKPQTISYHWLATYPKLFITLPAILFIWVQLIGESRLIPYVIAFFPFLYGLWVVGYFIFYQKFVLTEGGLATLVVGAFFGLMIFSGFSDLRSRYLSHPCSQLAQLVQETGCIRYFSFDSEVLGFTADNEALVLGNPEFFGGVLIQPITSWWPHVHSRFFISPFIQTLTQSGDRLFASNRVNEPIEMWNVISEEREQIYPFLTEQVEVFSPTGRYLLAQMNGRYLVADLESGVQTILPQVNLNSAVFSADEQQLYLLTYTEVLVWDTSRQTMSHTITPPAEWQGRSWSCLNLLGSDEFLLVIDSTELWRWSVSQNHTQKLFTSELRNLPKCEFIHGNDWLLIEESYAHLQLLNLADGQLLWQTSPMRFESWAVSPDGRYLAGSDSDYTYLFDFELLRQQP